MQRQKDQPESLLTRREFIRVGAVGSAGVVLLVACSGNGATSTTVASSSSSTAAAGPTSTVGGGALTGSLSVLADFTYAGVPGSMEQWISGLAAEFEEATGVTVDAATVPFADLRTRRQTAHAAMSGPAVQAHFENSNSYTEIESGFYLPLDDYIDEAEIDAWLLKSTPIGGQHYISPQFLEIASLIGNIELLEQAGVDPDANASSWEEFTEHLQALSQAGIVPIAAGSSDFISVLYWLQAHILQELDDPLQVTEWSIGEVDTDVAYMTTWIDRLVEMRDQAWIDPDVADLNAQQAFERFSAGQAGFHMANAGPSLALPADQFAFLPYWGGPGAAAAPVAAAGAGYMIASYGENPEAAAAFVRLMHDPSQLSAFHEVTGEFPADARFEPPADDPRKADVWALMTSGTEPVWPVDFSPAGIFDIYQSTAQSIFLGNPTADDVRAEFVQAAEAFRADNPEVIEDTRGFLEAARG